jgi:rhodanese-related sulfurtransferase
MGHRGARGRLALIAIGALALAACGGSGAAEPVAEAVSDNALPATGLVVPSVAAGLAVDDRITVIDVRTPEEFAAGHLEGAALIDFYADSFATEIAALDRDETYLIYCRSGNRSGQAHVLMQELGFEQVYDLDGGVNAWSAQGLALVAP